MSTSEAIHDGSLARGAIERFTPPAVERSDLQGRVLRQLRLAILTGDLKPGERVQQVSLARAFGVSTSPLREAIRDLISAGWLDNETYAGATVALPSLSVSAIGVAVAMAVSSAAAGLEAVAVLGAESVSEGDIAAVRDFAGTGVPVYLAAADGSVLEQILT